MAAARRSCMSKWTPHGAASKCDYALVAWQLTCKRGLALICRYPYQKCHDSCPLHAHLYCRLRRSLSASLSSSSMIWSPISESTEQQLPAAYRGLQLSQAWRGRATTRDACSALAHPYAVQRSFLVATAAQLSSGQLPYVRVRSSVTACGTVDCVVSR